MNPVKKFAAAILLICGLYFTSHGQNVGISTDGATPDASAMLDVSATDKGLLVPRVALTSTAAAGPITSPTTSLLVYNTATAGVAPDNVVPGYYYWNGTAWTPFGSGSNWSLAGNAGTDADANFIGTTDDADLVFHTDGAEVMRLLSGGGLELSAGLSFTSPLTALYAVDSTNNYLEVNVQNLHNGTLASSDIVATANNGSSGSVYVDMGINSAGYSNGNSNILNGPNVAYLYAHGRDFKIGNGTPNRDLVFFTNPSTGNLGTNTANGVERMRIMSYGTIGMGINNPSSSYTLHISGDAAKPGGGSWTSASDRRLKKDIVPFTEGLTTLVKINPVSFKYTGMGGQPNDGKDYVGIIAQEMKEIAPYTIGTFVDSETNIEYLNYDANAVTYILINAVKEQQSTIDALKKQLDEQNQRLLNLEEKLK